MDLDGLGAPDDLGPEAVMVLADARSGLDAVVVVDNTACGPSLGGVRIAPDVTGLEVARLARAMTLKNASAGLPFGGGKAGIRADPTTPQQRERLVRAFAIAIRDLRSYIPGPDMGTDERCMAWVHDEIGRSIGLPRVLGGIPLDEVRATGFGLAVCAGAVEAAGRLTVQGARVAVQGFGAVGTHAARYLAERGAVVVAVADRRGACADPDGIDLEELLAWKATGASVGAFPGAAPFDPGTFVGVDCDVWIPAARPDVITIDNVDELRASVVLEGANIPATVAAEERLHERGILVVPDFVANAGGVICAATEFEGGTQAQAFAAIEEKVRTNTAEVLTRSDKDGVPPRVAAEALARARLDEAASYRRQH